MRRCFKTLTQLEAEEQAFNARYTEQCRLVNELLFRKEKMKNSAKEELFALAEELVEPKQTVGKNTLPPEEKTVLESLVGNEVAKLVEANSTDARLTEVEEELQVVLTDLARTRTALSGLDPNFRCVAALEQTEREAADRQRALQAARKALAETEERLALAEGQRKAVLGQCLSFVQNKTKEVYNALSGGDCAFVFVGEELLFRAAPFGKRSASADLLSGGEQAVAVLAVLLAAADFLRIPLLVLDELDAPLDDLVIDAAMNFLVHLQEIDTLLVSHNLATFSRVDKLVGLYRNQDSTEVLTFDLSKYSD